MRTEELEDPLRLDAHLERAALRLEAAQRRLRRGKPAAPPLADDDWLDQRARPEGRSQLVLPPMVSSGGLWLPGTDGDEANATPGDPLRDALEGERQRLAAARAWWPTRASLAERWRDAEGDARLLSAREAWLTADSSPLRQRQAEEMAGAAAGVSDATLDAWNEALERHGSAEARAGTHALVEDTGHADDVSRAERLLDATHDLARDVVPGAWFDVIPTSLARDADAGWPRVRAGWAEASFRGTGLLEGLKLRLPPLTASVWGASTFARGLGALGVAVLRAGRPASVPYVLHRDPMREAQRRQLFADLVLSEPWLRRHVGVGRDRARSLRRSLTRARLVEARLRAASVLMLAALRDGAAAARERYADLGARMFGDPPPPALLATVPQLDGAAAQVRGGLAAVAQAQRLRERYDEDWFLNPRAAEALRAHDARATPGADPPLDVTDWVALLEAALS